MPQYRDPSDPLDLFSGSSGRHWLWWRKDKVVLAYRAQRSDLPVILRAYNISTEELQDWVKRKDRFGAEGLKETRGTRMMRKSNRSTKKKGRAARRQSVT